MSHSKARTHTKPVKLLEPPPMSLEEKLTPEEAKAFYDISSDRAIAIILSAIVENHLTILLRLIMRRDDERVADELFRPSGPLGPFGTKIRLAYLLRVVAPETYKDLLVISKIRNAFAHDMRITSFDDQKIADQIKNMHIYAVVKKMGEEATERLRNNESKGRFGHVRDQIARDDLSTLKDAYRACLAYMIHHIANFESSIRVTEESLNKNVVKKAGRRHLDKPKTTSRE